MDLWRSGSVVLPGNADLVRLSAGHWIPAPAPENARACTARGVRQPRRCVLTGHTATANPFPRADPDTQDNLHFRSIDSLDCQAPPLTVRALPLQEVP
jgi:hypothetical protein